MKLRYISTSQVKEEMSYEDGDHLGDEEYWEVKPDLEYWQLEKDSKIQGSLSGQQHSFVGVNLWCCLKLCQQKIAGCQFNRLPKSLPKSLLYCKKEAFPVLS